MKLRSFSHLYSVSTLLGEEFSLQSKMDFHSHREYLYSYLRRYIRQKCPCSLVNIVVGYGDLVLC
jgi:hypothetical protein